MFSTILIFTIIFFLIYALYRIYKIYFPGKPNKSQFYTDRREERQEQLNRLSNTPSEEQMQIRSLMEKNYALTEQIRLLVNERDVFQNFLSLAWLLLVVFLIILGSDGNCYAPSHPDPSVLEGNQTFFLYAPLIPIFLLSFADGGSKFQITLITIFVFLLPMSLSILIRCVLLV